MIVVQIAPEIGPGTGVAGVAASLEDAFGRAGVETRRFTLDDAHGGRLPRPQGRIASRLGLLARVVWFSTVGTVAARRYLRTVPDAVSICHNDALAGDVYVNHGIVQVALRNQGAFAWRMVRNPLHLFATARDAWRYRRGVHRAVVNLSSAEQDALTATFGRVRSAQHVIGNGVDLDRFRPATAAQRAAARARFGLDADARVVLFVGHEHERKGLPALLAALARVPAAHLLVVGGDADLVATARAQAAAAGVAGRCTFTGPVPDVEAAFHAADVFALPSAYESFGLVYLEALACGVPVVATPVGVVPDVVTPAVGAVTTADPGDLGRALDDLLHRDAATVRDAARAAAEAWSWDAVAARYLEVLRGIAPGAAGGAGAPTAPAAAAAAAAAALQTTGERR